MDRKLFYVSLSIEQSFVRALAPVGYCKLATSLKAMRAASASLVKVMDWN